MKRLIVIVIFFTLSSVLYGQEVNIVFWNVENLFYYKDTSKVKRDFSSEGQKRWTSKRYFKKLNDINKALCVISEKYDNSLDIICLAEIGCRKVLLNFINNDLYKKSQYKICHFESLDKRGIDVGLIYNSIKIKLVECKPCRIYKKGRCISTRDILMCRFIHEDMDFVIFVCHLPSKFSGNKSSVNRVLALKRLNDLCDSVSKFTPYYMAVGDFNEQASNYIFDDISLKMNNLGRLITKGSIKFKGQWSLIDFALTSKKLLSNIDVYDHEFLLEKDKKYGGFKPYRTYLYLMYKGGISDHLPIGIKIKK